MFDESLDPTFFTNYFIKSGPFIFCFEQKSNIQNARFLYMVYKQHLLYSGAPLIRYDFKKFNDCWGSQIKVKLNDILVVNGNDYKVHESSTDDVLKTIFKDVTKIILERKQLTDKRYKLDNPNRLLYLRSWKSKSKYSKKKRTIDKGISDSTISYAGEATTANFPNILKIPILQTHTNSSRSTFPATQSTSKISNIGFCGNQLYLLKNQSPTLLNDHHFLNVSKFQTNQTIIHQNTPNVNFCSQFQFETDLYIRPLSSISQTCNIKIK